MLPALDVVSFGPRPRTTRSSVFSYEKCHTSVLQLSSIKMALVCSLFAFVLQDRKLLLSTTASRLLVRVVRSEKQQSAELS